jgi:hypothetical protein
VTWSTLCPPSLNKNVVDKLIDHLIRWGEGVEHATVNLDGLTFRFKQVLIQQWGRPRNEASTCHSK